MCSLESPAWTSARPPYNLSQMRMSVTSVRGCGLHNPCSRVILVAAIMGDWRPFRGDRKCRRRKILELRCRVDGLAPDNRQNRFQLFDLFLCDGKVICG